MQSILYLYSIVQLIYQMKSTLGDEKLSAVIDSDLKDNLTKVIDDNLSWLENNQMASKEEYDSKLSELQEAMKPLQEKMMSGMNGMPQGFPGGIPEDMPSTKPSDETTHGGPKIEEVD